MGRNYSRVERVAEQIRRELAELVRTEVKDPRVGLATISAVEVSPDYTHAKVFFSTLSGAEAAESARDGLTRAAGYLRHALGQRVRLHHTPELRFVYDSSFDRGARLSQLIDEAVESDKHHPE